MLDSLGVNPMVELSILVVDSSAMATLHKQWMDLDGPTDVMAFPMDTLDDKPGMEADPGPALLGDVILCPEVAAEQAATAGHSTGAELYLLTTHGVLHLLGYDHGEPETSGRCSNCRRGWSPSGRSAPATARSGRRYPVPVPRNAA